MTVSSNGTEKLNYESAEDNLPDGWTWATVKEVTEDVPNVRPESEPTREFGYVDISSICNRTYRIIDPKRFRGEDAPSRARRPIQESDVIFSNVRTYLRNIALVPNDLDAQLCSTGFTLLRSNGAIDPRLLFHQVLTDRFIDLVSPQQTGSQYPATSDPVVMAASIRLPPLSEQSRIVAKIEECITHLNSARDHLSRVPAILKRFRQAVLAAACSGMLTEDWRGRQQDVEAADELVARISNQRLVADEHLAIRKVDRSSSLSTLPDEWTWVYLSDMGYMNRGKSRHRPRDAEHLYNGPYPFIQTGDIAQSGGKITAHQQTYSEAGLRQSRLWPAGTVCVTIAANIAHSAILTYPACFPDSVVGIIPDSNLCCKEYLEFFIRTARTDLEQYAPATAQKNINIAILHDVVVPLPPFREQREIVRRAEVLLTHADMIRSHVSSVSLRANKLTQSILAKAFRGELVTTEAELARREGREYEPASVLLERIKREKTLPNSGDAQRRRGTHRRGKRNASL